ncbi:MAG: hypothetical protein JKY02_09900 [Flavobacteriaceae bacterium]|nr:hypothetical protein [Flavobacteriaceae bacterium]
MLGVLLLFFIGKYYFKLAEKYKKSKWGYTVLGVVTYYGGTFIYGIIYGIIYFSMYPDAHESEVNNWTLMLTAIVAGLVSAFILYFLLERNWKKYEVVKDKTINIDEIGKDKPSEF